MQPREESLSFWRTFYVRMNSCSDFLFCIPSRSEPVVWSQPGGDDLQWSDMDKYAAALMKEAALRHGYSAADAQTLAIMATNKRIMNNIQYSDIWERRLAALGFI